MGPLRKIEQDEKEFSRRHQRPSTLGLGLYLVNGGTLNFLALYISSILERAFWGPVVEEERKGLRDEIHDGSTRFLFARVLLYALRVQDVRV